jgi:tryptophanase
MNIPKIVKVMLAYNCYFTKSLEQSYEKWTIKLVTSYEDDDVNCQITED